MEAAWAGFVSKSRHNTQLRSNLAFPAEESRPHARRVAMARMDVVLWRSVRPSRVSIWAPGFVFLQTGAGSDFQRRAPPLGSDLAMLRRLRAGGVASITVEWNATTVGQELGELGLA